MGVLTAGPAKEARAVEEGVRACDTHPMIGLAMPHISHISQLPS